MSAIAERFPGARQIDAVSEGRVELEVGGVTYRARVALEPVGLVSVQVPATDGFELALRWTDRGTAAMRAPSFDDSVLVETNDVALANVWLDPEVRDALIASRYVAGTSPLHDTALLLRDGTWSTSCAGTRSARDAHSARARPSGSRTCSWRRSRSPRGRCGGRSGSASSASGSARAASRVELGGRPILRVRRGPADVTVRLLRRLGPADSGRLRLVVSAHRHGSGGETLTLIADALPRAAWPPPNERGAGALAIDARARALLDAARPSTTIVRPHDIELTFDGGAVDAERLGAAIELAAHWAAPVSAPYR